MITVPRTLRRFWPAASPRTPEPSKALFQHIRWRLTIWYTAILAATLLLLGVALYGAVRSNLLGPVDSGLRSAAQSRAQDWLIFPDAPCHDRPGADTLLTACFDPGGNIVGINNIAAQLPDFTQRSVVATALRSGSATDTIVVRHLGGVERYSLRVTDPQSGTVLGVVEVGTPVSDRLNALQTLLTYLVQFGLLGLACAAVGGLFLAGRSLLPARLAYLRQRDFISDASHELRTPLTLLRADADVLLRDRKNLQPDHVAILEDIVLEAAHMSSLANNMLDLARLDAGQEHMEEDVVDLSELARQVAHRASNLAQSANVSVRADVGGTVLVVGDQTLIERVALILLDNAIKYNAPQGEVLLHVKREGESAIFEVVDTGIGIAPEHLPHMGERFFRVDKARSRASGGAGLGVAIAQSIATRLGGSLRLNSEQGKGTVAALVLPAADANRTTPS
jgi:signal transduction histidine kinase